MYYISLQIRNICASRIYHKKITWVLLWQVNIYNNYAGLLLGQTI